MTSYFDEHNCEPLGENERPNEQLLLARLLLDSGIANALEMTYPNLMNQNLAPPASKSWMQNNFPNYFFAESDKSGYQCPICLLRFSESCEKDKTAVKLPDCGHIFHVECLTKWLNHTSSCPMCRRDLPTDDPHYEEFKRQKKREKVREQELADLHDSMFS